MYTWCPECAHVMERVTSECENCGFDGREITAEDVTMMALGVLLFMFFAWRFAVWFLSIGVS